MKIVNAQIHIWSSGSPSGLHRKVSSFTAEEALREMDAAGVHAALIHPPVSWDPDASAFAVEAARTYPDRFAVMGQFPPRGPAKRHMIQGWRGQPGILGLRWALLQQRLIRQPTTRVLLPRRLLSWAQLRWRRIPPRRQ